MTAAADVHYRTCTLCEAMCGLEIRHAGEEILSIRGVSVEVRALAASETPAPEASRARAIDLWPGR